MPWIRRSSFATTEEGFVLVIVLIAVAVALLFTAETTFRVMREVRVTKLSEQSEKALFAADAGFNRVRARALKDGDKPGCGLDGTVNCILALNGREDTLTDGSQSFGTYRLGVELSNPGTYRVESRGTMGTGAYAAVRVVSGTITIDSDDVVTVAYDSGN